MHKAAVTKGALWIALWIWVAELSMMQCLERVVAIKAICLCPLLAFRAAHLVVNHVFPLLLCCSSVHF